jgi:hypothetical protein
MISTSLSYRFRALRLAGTALVAILVSSQATFADLLVYDPFGVSGGPGDYLIGNEDSGVNVLAGQNPVAGPTAFYSSPWIQSGGDAQAVQAGSLQYPLFPRAGGRVTDAVQFDCCSFGRNAREIAGGLGGGRLPRTIYQSFLVDFGNQGTDNPAQFGKRAVEWFNGYDGSSPDGELAVDLFVNHFSGINDFTLSVITPSGTNSALLNGGGLNLANMSGTHLIVMKFDFDPAAPDLVSLYLDPTDSTESNWTPAAVVSAPNSDLFITHHGATANFTFSGGGHNPASYDEVRWGDTFADVTPFVPEPSSLSLLVLASLGRFARRRRT